MLDFIFFHQLPMQRFKSYLEKQNISYEIDTEYQESIEETGFTVSIDEDHELNIIDEIEEFYDEMMALNEALVSSVEGDNEIKNAGITVNLSNGSSVLANVDPNILYKLSSALTPDEILALISAIADAVENPDSRPLCKR